MQSEAKKAKSHVPMENKKSYKYEIVSAGKILMESTEKNESELKGRAVSWRTKGSLRRRLV